MTLQPNEIFAGLKALIDSSNAAGAPAAIAPKMAQNEATSRVDFEQDRTTTLDQKSTFDTEFITGKFGNFNYEGFSALTIYAEIRARGGENWRIDLVNMIAIGLLRANPRQDQIEKTSAEGQKVINELVTRYGIPIRTKGKKLNLARHTITFTRAVSTLPNVAAILLANYNKGGGVAAKVVKELEGLAVNKLPGAMRFPAFAALIHNNFEDGIYRDLLACAEAWTYCFINTIGTEKKTYQDAAANVLTVLEKHEQTYESSLALLKRVRIFGKNDKLKASIVKVSEAWRKLSAPAIE